MPSLPMPSISIPSRLLRATTRVQASVFRTLLRLRAAFLVVVAALAGVTPAGTTLAGAAAAASAAAASPAPAAAAAAPADPAPRFPPDEIRADFDELYVRLAASHFDLYARRSKAEYDRLHARMRASFDRPLSADEVAIAFQPFLAYGRVAHARIDFPTAQFERYRAAGGRAFPLALRVVDDRTYVAENPSGVDAIVEGDELVAVDGEPGLRWLDRMTRPLSADTPYMARTMQEWSLPRLVYVAMGEVPSVTLRVRHADGRMANVVLPFRSRAEIAATRERRPATFELSWEARERRMLADRIAYLRPGPFYETDANAPSPWDPRGFGEFIDASFREFAAAGAQSLIVDLRDNPGGDNSFSDRLVEWIASRPFRFASAFRIRVSDAAIESNRRRMAKLGSDPTGIGAAFDRAYAGHRSGDIVDFEIPVVAPRAGERFDGRVVVLVNRHTYSNAVTVAATVQDYGFGTILGEETADLATTYGAMEDFTLTRTGVKVGFPKARIVRPSGSNVERGVVPDVRIRTPVVAGAEDEVLARTLAWLRSHE
jgi:C-terminal processing protease CtpA/Prc